MITKTRTLAPFTQDELLKAFHEEHGSINKHLLVLYSLAVGLDAKRVLDLGAGSTTRTLRAALQKTGGELFTCDFDAKKWRAVQEENQDPKWHFFIGDTKEFLPTLEGPFDLIIHDAAHDLWQVKWDLEKLIPMLRQYGILCIHDTQHSHLGEDMQKALSMAFQDYEVSWTHLPYQYGFTIIRVENKQPFESVTAPWKKKGYEGVTQIKTCGLIQTEKSQNTSASDKANYFKWVAKKLFKMKR